MFKKIGKLIILTLIYSYNLYGEEYKITLKAGWQLIGLPSDIDNMRVFNNSNVHLVWNYNAKYGEWEGYSPESDFRYAIEAKGLNALNSVERWQGIWVFSYNDWDLIIDEDKSLYSTAPNINTLQIYKGWNLLSLPFDAVFSQKVFERYKLWRYDEKTKSASNNGWQTNQSYSFLDFPKVDEINSKNGFWLYSPEDRELDLSEEAGTFSLSKDLTGATISSFKTYDEVQSFIENALLIYNREKKYWNWTPVVDMYEQENTTSTDITSSTRVDNAITNENRVNIRYAGVEEAHQLKEYNGYIFYLSGDKRSVNVVYLDYALSNSSASITKFTPDFGSGSSTIRDFFMNGTRLVIISDFQDTEKSTTFSNRCREQKSVVSVYDITLNPVGKSAEKHFFLDGDINETRMINNSIYIVNKFKPCIELDYPKDFLANSDPCNYPEDTIAYKTKCYDVLEDPITKKLFRYDYENPEVENIYSLPKYQININGSTTVGDLISPDSFYATKRLDQNTNIITLLQIDGVGGKIIKTSSIFGDIRNIHLSANSLYFTSNISPYFLSFRDYRGKTNIHKFSFYPSISYRAVGEIDGEPLDKFSLSERNQNLRVVAKEFLSWGEESYNNSLEIFKEVDGKLERGGRLLNIVNDAYTLHGVKFFGDLAIATTNSKNQPFQIVDLEDQSFPKRSGLFSLSGEPKYIHFSEIENRLITFGREILETGSKGGIGVEIFDISDISSPKLQKKRVFGDYYNYSPITISPKTLGYRSSDGALSIPIYSDGGTTDETLENGLYTYNLESLDTGFVETNYNGFLSVPTMSRITDDGETIFVDRSGRSYSIFLTSGKLNIQRIK